MSWRIGVDIGGTFTDAALVNEESGAIGIAKTLTTPDDYGQGVVNALTEAIKTYGVPTGDVSLLSHATTVVTNAILEEKGAQFNKGQASKEGVNADDKKDQAQSKENGKEPESLETLVSTES